jgi:hypothetical protein
MAKKVKGSYGKKNWKENRGKKEKTFLRTDQDKTSEASAL